MRSHIWHLFRKDGLELLRDRRTLFVNVVLPVLLFPLIILFMIQVTQLTRAQPTEAPRVAVLGAPELADLLPTGPPPAKDEASQQPAVEGDPLAEPAVRRGKSDARVEIAEIDAALAQEIRRLAQEVRERTPAKDDPADAARDAEAAALRADLLRLLRAERLAAVVIATDDEGGSRRLALAIDDAHPEWDQADAAIARGVDDWGRQLTLEQLRRVGLAEGVLSPVVVASVQLAPAAETLRSRFAGIIPLILVIMAASGAFYPAVDLFAGERERGTLESLLSWPVRRRDIFLGKLAVTCAAAVVSVVLNLSSLGLTTALMASQLAPPGAAGATAGGLLSVGFGTLLLCFLALLPLVVTLSAVSLALAGYAASVKEAQNYLSPLLIVVLVAALVAAIPGTRPSLPLDLIPITGPVLALKDALRSTDIPWLHLVLSTATSVALAVVIVGWAVRLLESERFCYPGLVRAGWGRFRKWGPPAEAPGAIEVIGLYAICVGAFTIGSGALERLGLPAFASIVLPLVMFIALPALLHAWLGAYPPRTGMHLAVPRREHMQRALVCIPLAVASSVGLATVFEPFIPDFFRETVAKGMNEKLEGIGGTFALVLGIAVAPGICEELLCRGTILAGLRRSTGAWGAAILSAFLFAILHLTPYRFVPQFAIGIILGLLTLRGGSVVPAIMLHIGHNAVIAVLAEHLQPGWWVGLLMGVSGWLAMLAIVALPEPRRRPAAIAPPAASTTPGTP